jgi:hypothetical protein
MKPDYLDELIDRASKAAGSGKALAQELEVANTVISDWKSGRKTCSPEDQALMAALAGLDAEAWGARAMIAKHAGTTKGAKLEGALKKALLATGAAAASFGAIAAENVAYLIRCIDCQQAKALTTIKILAGRESPWGGPPYPRTPQNRLTLIATGLS